MSEKNKEILSLLKQNSRLSVETISEIVNLPVTDVKETISNLEKNGTILKYTCVTKEDDQKDIIRAIIEVSVRPEKKSGYDTIAEKIASNKFVIDHYLVSGSYEFLIIVEATNFTEISGIISDLASMPNVTNTVSHFTLKRYKQMGTLLTHSKNTPRLAIVP